MIRTTTRAIWLAAAAILLPLAVYAAPFKLVELEVTTPVSSNSAATSTALADDGWIEEIAIDMVSAGSTTDVKVLRVNGIASMADEVVMTRTDATADFVTRPLVASHDLDGIVNSNAMVRYPVFANDYLKLMVTNATVTNVVWRAIISIDLNR